MGITLSIIQKMQNQGLFNAPAAAILDIGSSNLYQASLQGIKDFLTARGIAPSEHLNFSAKQLEEGSAYRPEGGNPNTAFAGQLFDMAAMQYASIDTAAG